MAFKLAEQRCKSITKNVKKLKRYVIDFEKKEKLEESVPILLGNYFRCRISKISLLINSFIKEDQESYESDEEFSYYEWADKIESFVNEIEMNAMKMEIHINSYLERNGISFEVPQLLQQFQEFYRKIYDVGGEIEDDRWEIVKDLNNPLEDEFYGY